MVQETGNTRKLVLLEIYTDWCSTCRTMEPVITRLLEKVSGKVEFIRTNQDENPALAALFKVRSVPSYILMKNGKEIWKQSGLMTASELEEIISKHAAKI